jgi:hypothetical protein
MTSGLVMHNFPMGMMCAHVMTSFKSKKFKYSGAVMTHCARVSDPEKYNLTG